MHPDASARTFLRNRDDEHELYTRYDRVLESSVALNKRLLVFSVDQRLCKNIERIMPARDVRDRHDSAQHTAHIVCRPGQHPNLQRLRSRRKDDRHGNHCDHGGRRRADHNGPSAHFAMRCYGLLNKLVDEGFEHFLAAAGVGGRVDLFVDIGFEFGEVGFAFLDLCADAAVP